MKKPLLFRFKWKLMPKGIRVQLIVLINLVEQVEYDSVFIGL